MNEAQHPPRLLFPALGPLYVFLEPLSWLLIRCACGLILAVHGWGKISRGAEAMAPTFAKLGYEHPAAILRRTPPPRLPRLFRRLGAGDDGRFDRARDQLLDHVPEIPFARARRIRDALALVAVSLFLGVFGRARRPLRSPAHHPGRHAVLHGGIARLGAAIPHRFARN